MSTSLDLMPSHRPRTRLAGLAEREDQPFSNWTRPARRAGASRRRLQRAAAAVPATSRATDGAEDRARDRATAGAEDRATARATDGAEARASGRAAAGRAPRALLGIHRSSIGQPRNTSEGHRELQGATLTACYAMRSLHAARLGHDLRSDAARTGSPDSTGHQSL